MASTGVRARSDRFLPPDPRVAEPYRLTPQLAVRIGIVGAIALGLFGILFFRLWALQVLSGPEYLHAAQNNQLRSVPLEAPRGAILDRNGHALVVNRAGTAVQVWPVDLARKGSYGRLKRLAQILDVPMRDITSQLEKRKDDPLTPVTVKESVNEAEVKYIEEHQAEFPGVFVANTYLRDYVFPGLAAQVLGYVGEISPAELKRRAKHGYRLGDKIGQAGIEATYDRYLRGRAGLAQVRVDALARPQGGPVIRRRPGTGQAVRTTLDISLQRAAERALQYGIELARANNQWAANGGAIVALDPRDGAIRALASAPTYDPRVYVGRVRAKRLAEEGLAPATAPERNYPAINRAIAGLYPAGSTFKPVTALAALQEHVLSPDEVLDCPGSISIYDQPFRNWNPYPSGSMDLTTAIAQSCDTFFYQLGERFYELPKERGQPLQAWARRFGFGLPTGVDIPGEQTGLLPTIRWRQRTFKTAEDKLWKPGDSVQLTIGQKDLLVTPLQMARFYAAVANGGWLVQPHLLASVETLGDERTPGTVLRRYTPPPRQHTGVDPGALALVRAGLYQATHHPLGTATGVFGSFDYTISGKTGTAEKYVELPGFAGMMDQSWWCGYGPDDDPELVVCALIENGGHGSEAAAPAALRVFEEHFDAQGQIGQIFGD